MKKFLSLCTLLVLVLSLMAAGCGSEQREQAAGGSEAQRQLDRQDGTCHIVTSFYPIYIATANIAKGIEGVTVVNMTQPQTGCLHDYQLTTEDMKKLAKADIFVANGAGMESFLDKVIKENKKLIVVEASQSIPLLQDDGETNPHVWLNIDNAITQVDNICHSLATADPAHAAAYTANAEAYKAKLKALQTRMHQELDNLPHREIVTFHEAFPYFAQEFHLDIEDSIQREPGTEPTPKELQDTIQEVREMPVKVLFTEPQYSPAAAETISRETGAKIYTLDPVVTGEANEQALDGYIRAMEENAKVLKEALQ